MFASRSAPRSAVDFGSRPSGTGGLGSVGAAAPTVQAKFAARAPSGVSPQVERGIQSARGGGQPLAESVRGPMERAMGVDFGRTRVHTDAGADTLAQSLHAHAFTTGSDIFFRRGAYDPGSAKGRETLAHELTHVVQQGGSGGAAASRPQTLSLGPPGDAYEREADRVAHTVSDAIARGEGGAPAADVGGPHPGGGPTQGAVNPLAAAAPSAPVGRIQRVPAIVYAAAGGGKPGSATAQLKANNMGGGTAAKAAIIPPGFKGQAPYGHHRGHMIANSMGGPGTNANNLVALTPGTNSNKMKTAELALRNYVLTKVPATKNKVEYKVTANYGGNFQGGSPAGTAFPATKWIAPPAPSSVNLKAKWLKKVGGAWVNQGAVVSGGFANNMTIKNGQ